MGRVTRAAAFEVSIHRLPEFASVKLSGPVTLDDDVGLIGRTAEDSRRIGDRRMLVDQLAVEGELKFTDRIGEEVALHLRHLERLASVVPPDRITRTSEKGRAAPGHAVAHVHLDERGDPVAAGAGRAGARLSHVSLLRSGSRIGILRLRNSAFHGEGAQMSIHTNVRPITILAVALAAALAAGCASRTDHAATMGGPGVTAGTGPGSTAPSGTKGTSNNSVTAPAAPGTSGTGTPGTTGNTGGMSGSTGSGTTGSGGSTTR